MHFNIVPTKYVDAVSPCYHGKNCHSLERNSTLPSHSNPFRVIWGITHEDNYLRSLILFLMCYIYRKHSSIYNLRISS